MIKRSLFLEQLENRCLLANTTAVDPAWFGNAAESAIEFEPVAANKRPGNEWIVQLAGSALSHTATVDDAAQLLGQHGIEVRGGLGLPGLLTVATPSPQAAAIEASPLFDFAEPNHAISIHDTIERQPNDQYFWQQWALENTGQTGGVAGADIDALAAWDVTKGDEDIIVGIIDTGVDYLHADLFPRMWVNPGERGGLPGVDDDGNGFVDDLYGLDTYEADSDPFDDHGHGTHVAGIVAAEQDNFIGVSGISKARMMALRFLGPSGQGFVDDAIAAINYATLMRSRGENVRVLNASWGGRSYSQALYDAIKRAGDAGILFVAAAGNSGGNSDEAPLFPAAYDLDNIISVAASTDRDSLASFSSWGPRSVDLAAPGKSIYSTLPLSHFPVSRSGTSMAAPHVAGVSVLVWSVSPEATIAQVKQAILSSAEPMSLPRQFTVTNGRLNAARALTVFVAKEPVHRYYNFLLGDNATYRPSLSGYAEEQFLGYAFDAPGTGRVPIYGGLVIYADPTKINHFLDTTPVLPRIDTAGIWLPVKSEPLFYVHENPIAGAVALQQAFDLVHSNTFTTLGLSQEPEHVRQTSVLVQTLGFVFPQTTTSSMSAIHVDGPVSVSAASSALAKADLSLSQAMVLPPEQGWYEFEVGPVPDERLESIHQVLPAGSPRVVYPRGRVTSRHPAVRVTSPSQSLLPLDDKTVGADFWQLDVISKLTS